MKKLTILLTTALAFGFGFGFKFTSASAFADSETPEISVEETIPEVPETSEIPEIPEVPEVPEASEAPENVVASTFEEFLEWTKTEAEKYGHGDAYKEALNAIKTAATTKQVTLSTLCSIAVALIVVVYIIRQKLKDKNLKNYVSNLADQLNQLIKGTNILADETNANATTEKKTQEEVENLEKEVKKLQHGLRDFTTAFLRFADGVKIGDCKKSEVQSNCISAIKHFEEVEKNDVIKK